MLVGMLLSAAMASPPIQMTATETPAGILALPAGANEDKQAWTPERGVATFQHPALQISVTWRPSNPDAGSLEGLIRQADVARQSLSELSLNAPQSRVVAGQPAALLTSPDADLAILSWYCPVTQRGLSLVIEGAPAAVSAALSASEAQNTCPTAPLKSATVALPAIPDGWSVTEQAPTHTLLQSADGSAMANLMMVGAYQPSLHGSCQDYSKVLFGSLFGTDTQIRGVRVVDTDHAGCRFQGALLWEASGVENAFDVTIRSCPATAALPQPPEALGLGVMLLYTPDQQLTDLPDFQGLARCEPPPAG